MQEGRPAEITVTDSLELLKQSEDRYHRMIAEIDEYAIILLSKEGIIQTWNKGAEKIKQYTESEAVGKHFEMFYLPEDRAAQLPSRLLTEAAETGRAIHEGWRMRKDRSRFWGSITLTAVHDNSGAVVGFSKVTRDLTDRKNAEEKLRIYAEELQARNEALLSSEERYHKMIAEVQDYAIILLSRNGEIENWNAGAERIKGYSAKEAIGRNFRIFYLPEDRARKLPEQLIGEATSNGKAVHEGWRIRKDGTRFWGSIVITALHGSDGSIIGFSKVTRDLTEKKVADDKIRDYAKALEVTNKELEQFAYVASHDLQEPLRKIQTFTEVIAENIRDEQLVNRYLEKIKSSSARMAQLVRAVLDYSRVPDDVTRAPVELRKVIKEVLSEMELVIDERGAKIKTSTLPMIQADETQMHQLFSNLIGNALKFCHRQPEITISSGLVDKKEIDAPPDWFHAEEYYQILVADNGIGFDQQFADKIFSMFQRLHAKHEYSGTGIGLAICRRIVENHGGYIQAKGESGKGATFIIYFPVVEL